MKSKTLDAVSLLLSDSRGIYIPQHFAQDFDLAAWGIDPESEDIKSLNEGPESEWYWEAWESILNKAQYRDAADNVYTLHQDGDLWALCVERMTDEEKSNFGFGE